MEYIRDDQVLIMVMGLNTYYFRNYFRYQINFGSEICMIGVNEQISVANINYAKQKKRTPGILSNINTIQSARSNN